MAKSTKRRAINHRAQRVAITFHVDRDQMREIAAAARECGVKLDAFCGEAIAQWLEQYAIAKGAEPVAHSFSEVDARQAAPPPRDVLDIATAAHDPRIRAGIASDHVEPDYATQDDEAPRVDSRANDPDDDDGATFPTRRPTGEGPRRIANRAEPEEDEDDGPRTVTPLAASLFRTPNPAGIKWKQGKDYGTRSQGHDWAAVRRPK